MGIHGSLECFLRSCFYFFFKLLRKQVLQWGSEGLMIMYRSIILWFKCSKNAKHDSQQDFKSIQGDGAWQLRGSSSLPESPATSPHPDALIQMAGNPSSSFNSHTHHFPGHYPGKAPRRNPKAHWLCLPNWLRAEVSSISTNPCGQPCCTRSGQHKTEHWMIPLQVEHPLSLSPQFHGIPRYFSEVLPPSLSGQLLREEFSVKPSKHIT